MLQLAESIDDRFAREQQLNDFLSFLDHHPHFLKKHVEYNPEKTNVIAVLRTPESLSPRIDKFEYIRNWFYGVNIVTNDGDIFYALQAAEEAPAANEDFNAGRFELQNPGIQDTTAKTDTYTQVTTPITASRKTFAATYPKTNDGDVDNTGAGVDICTYLGSWTTSDFNANGINGGCIHDNASPVGATKLLTHYLITSFNKTTNDTLKVFVNHTMNGV